MKLVWSPESASKAYIDTVKSCRNFKESGVAEFLSAMAAGWNAKLIVEAWSHGGPIATSVGLSVAARHAGARHVCVVPDERSRSAYVKAMYEFGMSATEMVVGDAEEVMVRLAGVDFLVVDCKRKDLARVLRFARFSHKGAVLACKNACQRAAAGGGTSAGFRWHGVLQRGTRVVRSVFLPVGQGLDIAHVGSNNGRGENPKKSPSRWIKHIDQRSGEVHLFRG
ncbi:hypothetical protein ACOSP7_001176 [Xanthoceras sorbifolium]|uniref:S-adenosyl-L-methionine-dependent methyltransferase n=1 Tax=Xanthoceras sorbifolium TaxID=99658 RepID=A0ABQ8INU1_9ROSI|nr:hypothetical protein JRO89_XS01G0298700 [Xanthoceras sorbifolium]